MYGVTGSIYDYGFRIYDPRLARFLSIDPLQKDYPELTPYQFASNTPIQAIDLDGLEQKKINKKFSISDCMDWNRSGGARTKPKSHIDIKGFIKDIAKAIHHTKPKPKKADDSFSDNDDDPDKTGGKKDTPAKDDQPSLKDEDPFPAKGTFSLETYREDKTPTEWLKIHPIKKWNQENILDKKTDLIPKEYDKIRVRVKKESQSDIMEELKKQGFDTRKVEFFEPKNNSQQFEIYFPPKHP